jgi:DNA-binding NtrC family response regulator
MEHKPKLLIVDDEEIALANLEYVLSKEGYEVVGLQSGAAALERLKQEEFNVVVTDFRMPKVDGMEIIKRCREWHPDTQLIMITGYPTERSDAEVMDKDTYHLIAKPFRLDEVRRVVAEAVKKYRLKKSTKT